MNQRQRELIDYYAWYAPHLRWLRAICIEAVDPGPGPAARANLRDANLRGANLRGANLRGANLRGANLRDADLSGADLRDADLRDADLCRADLRDADLCRADLREANLRGANLRGANLRGANLRRANLRDADLSGADLCWADLRDADLRRADLRGANLRDADLRRADLRGAKLPKCVPVVPRIDVQILDAVEHGGTLKMNTWHTCQTTHCRGGWAIHLAGDAGEELERKVGTAVAAALIYAASRPDQPIPDFYAADEAAMADLVACASRQVGLA